MNKTRMSRIVPTRTRTASIRVWLAWPRATVVVVDVVALLASLEPVVDELVAVDEVSLTLVMASER